MARALFHTGRSGSTDTRGEWRDDRTSSLQVVRAVGREPALRGAGAERIDRDAAVRGLVQPRSSRVMKAPPAHVWFGTIHPFDDGNGRIARAIADMALARSEGRPQGLPMSAKIRSRARRLQRSSN